MAEIVIKISEVRVNLWLTNLSLDGTLFVGWLSCIWMTLVSMAGPLSFGGRLVLGLFLSWLLSCLCVTLLCLDDSSVSEWLSYLFWLMTLLSLGDSLVSEWLSFLWVTLLSLDDSLISYLLVTLLFMCYTPESCLLSVLSTHFCLSQSLDIFFVPVRIC